MASAILDCGEQLHISNFNLQSREHRWPDARRNHVYSDGNHVLRNGNAEYPEFVDDKSWAGPPYIALWRMNLVALSQKYNLYFVASRDRIHVYIPRNLKQALPSQPDLILPLPKSEHSRRVGGYIDCRHPHSVNHMILGNFGDLEILLMACDDGDVIAFYTHQFQAMFEDVSRTSRICDTSNIRPFFHENVGISAWGLAIHQQSRLIAVSSNHREVTIFAMATSGRYDTEQPLDEFDDSENFLPLEDIPSFQRPQSFHDREQNFCIRSQLDEEGSNIPTITFVSDGEGEAAKVVACDINGWAWLIDPWEGIENATRHGSNLVGGYSDIDGGERSWGVVCLSPKHFRIAKDTLEAWNLPKESSWISVDKRGDVRKTFVNVISRTASATAALNDELEKRDPGLLIEDVCTGSLDLDEKDENSYNTSVAGHNVLQRLDVPYSAALEVLRGNIERRQVLLGHRGPTKRKDIGLGDVASIYTIGSRRSDETATQRLLSALTRSSPSHSFAHRITAESLRLEHLHNVAREYRLFGEWLFCFLRLSNKLRNLCRGAQGIRSDVDYTDYDNLDPESHAVFEEVPVHEPFPLLLFRTYSEDMELTQPLAPSELPTRLISPKLSQDNPALRRFNMVAHVPELNIILAGSQCGEVAIIVLTQLLDPNGLRDPFFTFRQEAVLPLPQHLEKHKVEIKPRTLLLGMATSPIQGTIDDDRRALVGRRWRVILHYYDHTIMSYELGWRSHNSMSFGDGDCITG